MRQLATLDVLDGKGEIDIKLAATSESGYSDTVERKTTVVPKGFPFHLYASSQLKYEYKEGRGRGSVVAGNKLMIYEQSKHNCRARI